MRSSSSTVFSRLLGFRLPSIVLIVILLLDLLYSSSDLASGSTSYNFSGVSRAASHVLLAGLIGVIGAYAASLPPLREKTPYTVILCIMAVYTFFGCVLSGASFWTTCTYTGFIAWWVLTYLFSVKYVRSKQQGFTHIMLFAGILFAFYVSNFITTYFVANSGDSENLRTLNIIFRVLVFLPFVMLVPNRAIRNVLIVLIAALAVASVKRAALIALPVMLVGYVMVESYVKSRSLGGICRVAALIICVFLAALLADYLTGGYLSYRFSSEQLANASGRTERWADTIAALSQRGIVELLVGTGVGSAGYSQHNEWLEQLYSFGLIGLLLYVALAAILIRTLFLYCKRKSRFAPAYSMIVAYFFIVGFTSGFLFMHSTFYIFLFMGMVQGAERLMPGNGSAERKE